MKRKMRVIPTVHRRLRQWLKALIATMNHTINQSLAWGRTQKHSFWRASSFSFAKGLVMVGAVALGSLSGNANASDLVTNLSNAHETYYWFCKYGGNKHRYEVWRYATILTVFDGENQNLDTIKYTNWEKWEDPDWCINDHSGAAATELWATTTALVRDSVRSTYNYGTLSNLTVARTGLWN